MLTHQPAVQQNHLPLAVAIAAVAVVGAVGVVVASLPPAALPTLFGL